MKRVCYHGPPMTSRAAALTVAALFASGCAGVPQLPWAKEPPPPPPPSEYAGMGFGSVFEPTASGDRVLVTADFVSLEDTVLDLPDEYATDWLRLVVSDPAEPSTRSPNVVTAERNRRFLSELKPGQRLDLLARRVTHTDSMLNAGAPTIVLKVERLRRHVPTAAAASAPAPTPMPDKPLVYANDRSPKDRLRLLPNGRFDLRQSGQDVGGSYELEGDRVVFSLPGGVRSSGRRSGDSLTDPDGKAWRLESAAAPPAAPVAPVVAPPPVSPPAAPVQTLSFVVEGSPDDRLKLRSDGRFEIRERGADVTGTYEQSGGKLVFILPGGRRADGGRSGDTVTDPAGKVWTLEGAAAPARAPEKAEPIVFVNDRSKDDRFTLHPDGRFELRQRGKDVAGTFEARGEKLVFVLPGGQKASGKRSGDSLTDPDGKPWQLLK